MLLIAEGQNREPLFIYYQMQHVDWIDRLSLPLHWCPIKCCEIISNNQHHHHHLYHHHHSDPSIIAIGVYIYLQ